MVRGGVAVAPEKSTALSATWSLARGVVVPIPTFCAVAKNVTVLDTTNSKYFFTRLFV